MYRVDVEPPAGALPLAYLKKHQPFIKRWNELAVPSLPRYHWSKILALLLNSHLVIGRTPPSA